MTVSPDSKEELISIKYVAILRHSCGYVRADTYCSAILAAVAAINQSKAPCKAGLPTIMSGALRLRSEIYGSEA